ncbi:hypothetical protein H4R33_004830 [Dimargaris cristalligena]|nr:hypothetical protein H4R33_004830 [Dimargaris cristalligena]
MAAPRIPFSFSRPWGPLAHAPKSGRGTWQCPPCGRSPPFPLPLSGATFFHTGPARVRRLSASEWGRQYERAVTRALRRFGLVGLHSGRTGDRGIDIRGRWMLPDLPHGPLSFVAQCKYGIPLESLAATQGCSSSISTTTTATTAAAVMEGQASTGERSPTRTRVLRSLGPAGVRDLEGVLSHETTGTLGMLISNRPFTSAATRQVLSSRYPLVMINLGATASTSVSPLPSSKEMGSICPNDLRCTGLQWNYQAEPYLTGLVAVPRFSPFSRASTGVDVHQEIVLLMNGRPVEPV